MVSTEFTGRARILCSWGEPGVCYILTLLTCYTLLTKPFVEEARKYKLHQASVCLCIPRWLDLMYTSYSVGACYISKQWMQDPGVTYVLASKCACSKTISKFLVATMPNSLTSPTHSRSTDFIVGEYCTENSKPFYPIPTPIRCCRHGRGRGCLLYTIEELWMY